MDKIYISGIQYDSCVNGIGFRDVVYISGCWHKCMEHCHNKESHNAKNGNEYDIYDLINNITSRSSNNITISGGDGLTYQIEETYKLIKELKLKHNKNIWVYTGYTYEELLSDSNSTRQKILKYIDVLVDGNFNPAYKDESCIFKGDSTQRIIDVQKSLKENKVVLTIDKYLKI